MKTALQSICKNVSQKRKKEKKKKYIYIYIYVKIVHIGGDVIKI